MQYRCVNAYNNDQITLVNIVIIIALTMAPRVRFAISAINQQTLHTPLVARWTLYEWSGNLRIVLLVNSPSVDYVLWTYS